MPTVKQALSANIKHKMPCNGFFFQLLAASASVDINFVTAGATPQSEQNTDIDAGFWFKSPVLLTFVEISSAVDQVIEYVYSLGQTGYDRSQTVTTLLQSSGITDKPAVAVTNVLSQVVIANNDRRRVVFFADAANTDVICLGGDGLTAGNGAIVLEAGDTWVEDAAAIGDIYAISASGVQAMRISEA